MKRNVRLTVSPLAILVALLPAISFFAPLAPVQAAEPAPGDWPSYSRDAGGSNFSPLARIDKTNVAQLRRAWTYHTGDLYRGTRFDVFDSDPKSVASPGLALEIKFTGGLSCGTALSILCCE